MGEAIHIGLGDNEMGTVAFQCRLLGWVCAAGVCACYRSISDMIFCLFA